MADGWYPMASHRLAIDLAPGEETTAVYCLGYIENGSQEKWAAPGIINKKKAKALIAKYADTQGR
jgi:cellobiose phosphorylase